MDNQNHQQNQNLKQEQDKGLKPGEGKSADTEQITEEQNASQSIEQENKDKTTKNKKIKQEKKTIEQQLAELDARRQRLIEKKRSQDAHEKIVFGATVIAMLKDMKERGDKNGPIISKTIWAFTMAEQPKNKKIIEKIISEI